jgi:DNA-binding NarL/FixJ family response regulator
VVVDYIKRSNLGGERGKIHCGSILLVDDDPDVRALVASVLEAAGHTVQEAATGSEALAAARAERPALVLLDVCLPGPGGYSILRDLRALLGEQLPIIFLSGERTHPLDSASGLFLGADDYILKPFHPEELLARVQRLLPRPVLEVRSQLGQAAELTPREQEVLTLLAWGLNQPEIAGRLVISEKTVETHIQNVLSKLGVHSRAQAVAVAHRDGLVGTAAGRSARPGDGAIVRS